ncbi:MAG: hypothetical protein K2N95_18545 [Lachnospiraceae bacterium]|nr:hypothetical protein [Lachnospiraceae bacterium]
MRSLTDQTEVIHWHPGFYGAIELELKQNKSDLIFESEHQLSKEPLRMDMLIIKKQGDVVVQNEIGQLFRRYNVLEFKSPDDGLSIDDLFKTIGYACIYKGLGETVDAIPEDELTVSIFREAFPRELFEKLKQSGRRVEERFPGIYYVTGNLLFDTQIVVTKDLSKKAHRYLKLLSKTVKEQDVRELIEDSSLLQTPGDRHNVAAVLEVIFAVDRKLRKAIEEDNAMGEILDEMLKDRIDAKLTEQAKKAAIVMYENDTPLSVIATAFDVPVATVQKWLEPVHA